MTSRIHRLDATGEMKTRQDNSTLNHTEFFSGEAVLRSYPRRITLELTNRCNFDCVICGREPTGFVPRDMPLSAVLCCEEALERCEEVVLCGWGEGTLHPEIDNILWYLNGFKSLKKRLVTNGSTINRISGIIIDHRIDEIDVSIDGSSASVNDSIRRGGRFSREVFNAKRLVEEKAKRNLDYPCVNFVFTAMARNIHELPGVVELARETGAKTVNVTYMTVFEESMLGETLLDKQPLVRMWFGEAQRRAADLGVVLRTPDIQGEGTADGLAHKPCVMPWSELFIGSDCHVRPCRTSSVKLFHLFSHETFNDAWNSFQMREMRRVVNDENLQHDGCAKCYHPSCANWNKLHGFIQTARPFATSWLPEIDGSSFDPEARSKSDDLAADSAKAF